MPSNTEIFAKCVVFDLDGTLVDSAPSIMASMLAAFNEVGIEPNQPLTPDIVGPTLTVAMASLLAEASRAKLPRLTEAFKRHYDEAGYRETKIYGGVPEMLKDLRKIGCSLYIATNKRDFPTRKIINFFGWTDFFDGLYCIDSFKPALQNKAAILQRLVHELPETSPQRIYVGDRAEDGIAANSNGFNFLWASWGYEAFALENSNYIFVENPGQIIEIVSRQFGLNSPVQGSFKSVTSSRLSWGRPFR